MQHHFYHAAAEVLIRHDAIIDKLIGDDVMALFIPGSTVLITEEAPPKPR